MQPLRPLSFQQRNDAIRRMADEGVDVLVVGGGITGAGVALDAAARGYRVGLIEKDDFSSGTSSKSTKLVHGGIRYLSQFDFALVRESLVERGLLMRNAPFLVHPIGFLLPLYSDAVQPMGMPFRPPRGVGLGLLMRAGLLTYDLMSGRLSIRRHRRISKHAAERLSPCLQTRKLREAFIYYDAQTDDSRLTVTVVRTAALHGAMVANYVELKGFLREGEKITSALAKDHVSGETLTIKARIVVSAAGVFAGRVEDMAGEGYEQSGSVSNISIKPAKGVHLTVPRSALRLGKHAVVLPETDDGRLLFLVPWGSRVTIGTTDTEGGDIERPISGADDIEYLLRHVNRYMRCQLKESDIISAWAGYRPLVSSSKGARASSKLSRTHAVLDGPGGLVTIVGGKLTTYRRMSQDTVDHVVKRLGEGTEKRPTRVTEHMPLSGSDGWQRAQEEIGAAASRWQLGEDTRTRLSAYGANSRAIVAIIEREPGLAERIVSDLPYILAEVVYACRYEMALELADVLERRLRIGLEDWSHGLDAAPRVAALMARELGWDTVETKRQLERFSALVAELYSRPHLGANANMGADVGVGTTLKVERV